ncbi:MAG: hypothetical protein K8T25_16030 [Planctomycetia bacterium]|nr:hypothetical protein [Planctomycetia bacterium]
MNTPTPRELPRSLRNKLILYQLKVPLVVLGILWLNFLLALFGIDVIHWLKGEEPPISPTVFWGWLNAAATPGVFFWAWFEIRRAIRLATFGREVKATVIAFAPVGHSNNMQVHCKYIMDGRSYKAIHYRDGDEVHLGAEFAFLVDPANPKRARPIDQIFPLN